MLTLMRTAEEYRAAFETECARVYPMIDAFESSMGYAVDRKRLEAAAAVLACPLKTSPPNWQHGRVLYAAARKYLEGKPAGGWNILDIGTAKGFSALCLQWALTDHAGAHTVGVTSVDVLDPHARVQRKTIAEVDGFLTLAETLAPWPDAQAIRFEHSTGIEWLTAHPERIHLAFVDGSHDGAVVLKEGCLLEKRQDKGDLAIFDDVDRQDIANAIALLSDSYQFDCLTALPTRRQYAIGVRQ